MLLLFASTLCALCAEGQNIHLLPQLSFFLNYPLNIQVHHIYKLYFLLFGMVSPEVRNSSLKKVIEIAVFLVLLIILNLVAKSYNNSSFQFFVSFVNSNIWIILSFSLLFAIGGIFILLRFPYNIVGPFFNACASLLLTIFVFGIFGFLETLLGIRVFGFFSDEM